MLAAVLSRMDEPTGLVAEVCFLTLEAAYATEAIA